MRFSSLLWITLCAATTLAATPAPTATGTPGGRGRGAAAPAGLGQAMTEMNAMLTQIKADATDPAKTDQTIRNISTFARDVAIAKLQTPPYVNQMADAAAKAKAMATFRSMMNDLTRTLLDLEDAVNAKKPDDIKKAIAKLEEMEKTGHTEFHVGG